jgi:hypothetical protein
MENFFEISFHMPNRNFKKFDEKMFFIKGIE